MTREVRLACVVLLAVTTGCGSSTNNGGSHDMSVGGGDGGGVIDMTPPNDLTDTTPIPAPTVKHVGATGTTCCIFTDGAAHAAYLLNPTAAPNTTGALHVAAADGTDISVATGVVPGGFVLAPDGKSIFFTQPAGQSNALLWADLTAATVSPKTLFTTGFPSPQLTPNNFFSPSGKYFLVGILAANVNGSPDLHVIDVATGTDVYQRPNGEFDYLEEVLPDDTMIFQDTANGTSPNSPPVQTLYWVTLPGTTPAAAITTHTATFTTTADNKTLLILKTSGELLTWDITTKTGSGTTLATGVASFTIGSSPTGPVAYLGSDHSVHVIGTDGTKLLDLDATTAAADLFGPPRLSPDAGHLYYWQNFDSQDTRGSLMHVLVSANATPKKVGDNISSLDVGITDTALVLLQNVDAMGQFGDVVTSGLDGSNLKALGTKANVGGLRLVNPGPATWFAMHLTGAAADAAHTPVDGSPALLGALGFDDYTGAAEASLDTMVHFGTFAFSDDGRDAAYVTGATFNATAGNYVGSLAFLATRAPSMKVDGMLTGVSELGPIVNRSLFVNAPTATMAGVYFVKY